jgi:hypothetical protein
MVLTHERQLSFSRRSKNQAGGSSFVKDSTSSPTEETDMPTAKPTPGKMLLSPTDHSLILIDFQPQMAFATKSIDSVMLRNNAGLTPEKATASGETALN